jgi:hypothetical protein
MSNMIRAGWRRVVQTAPYESETLELAVELDADGVKGSHIDAVADLSRMLAQQGDVLLVERLAERTQKVAAPGPKAGRVFPRTQPAEPDDFLGGDGGASETSRR